MASHEPLDAALQEELLEVARRSIEHGLVEHQPLAVDPADFPPPLRAERASFVTLSREGRLRGCIGALEARVPLVRDVAQHAYGAAFQDPRFQPVQPHELGDLDIHISILTPNEPLVFTDEADLLAQLRPGRDGLIIAKGPRRATFLPSVWESLPDPHGFLAHLKLKAGISDADPAPLQAWRYTTESFGRE